MSEGRRVDPVQRLFGLLAEHFEAWLDGDELALDSLGRAIEESGLDEEQLEAALLALRSLAGGFAGGAVASLEEAPGQRAERVPSREERDSLSPEAWGFLLGLRQRGSLDPSQFEQVLDRLTASGVRPIGVELAREVAVRVALRGPGREESTEYGAGDGELTH